MRLGRSAALLLVLVFLTASCIIMFSPSKAQSLGSVYIKADGSVVGTDLIQRDGNNYTLIGNIPDGLVVEKDNTEINGAGYSLQGKGDGMGIYLNDRANVTIRNTIIQNFTTGIWIASSSNSTISGNNITANSWAGIQQAASFNNTIFGNSITNSLYGVWLAACYNNSIFSNNVTNNGYGISLTEDPWVGSSFNNNISRNNLANNDYGMFLTTSGSSMNGNNITETTICVTFISSFNNNFSGNNLSGKNNAPGLGLSSSSNNNISGNSITNTNQGIAFVFSHYNVISGNYIANNGEGIGLTRSFNNTIYDNDITNNSRGVTLSSSSNNKFFHNNFDSNRLHQVSVQSQPAVNDPDFSPSINVFDDGYPSGGNYWSDYLTRYPDASQIGTSGIGNTAYLIDANNTDGYPLMTPYGGSLSSPPNPNPSPTSDSTTKETDSSAPTTSAKETATVQAKTDNGETVTLIVNGNITSSQMSNVTITTNQSATTTTLSFTLTGETGTSGFSNITIPKNALLYGTTPKIYVDDQLAENQGFTQDDNYFYAWYTAHFSTHEVSIVFTSAVSSTKSTGQENTPQAAFYEIATSVAVMAIVAAGVGFVVYTKKRKRQQPE